MWVDMQVSKWCPPYMEENTDIEILMCLKL
jgi:hypothetical protein